MSAIVADTDVFSFLIRDGEFAQRYQRHVDQRRLTLSFVSIGELYTWAIRRKWGATRLEELEEKIDAAGVLPLDVEVCRCYAKLKTEPKTAQGSQRVIADNDLWIASCAVRHGLSLLTHNRRHFAGLPGLQLITEAP